jgi:hypothetical protein
MNQDIITTLQKHDRNILKNARQMPPQLPLEIEKNLSALDEDARELAVELVREQDSEPAGTFLLQMTGDSSLNVAGLAVNSIRKISNKPKVHEIIQAIPKRENPFIRARLYLEAGNSNEKDAIQGLRDIFTKEQDEEVKLNGLAALTKLHGQPEKNRFVEIVSNTTPDDAIQIQELILYIGKAEVAKGMITWLQSEEDVTRISTDENVVMARMCDIAVWTAHLLKIKLPFETTHLRNYKKEEIEATRKVLELLPN